MTETKKLIPVAWMFKEVIHCGQGQFYDSDWKVSLNKPADKCVQVTPLYAHPPRTGLRAARFVAGVGKP